MNGLLTAEELEVQEQVRHFATSKLLPRIVKDNQEEKFDRDIMYEMGEMGLLGATIQGMTILIFLMSFRVWLHRCKLRHLRSHCQRSWARW